MATCKAINSAGIVCNQKANDSTYFWFYDPNGRINQVFHLCKLHSNLIINDLMVKENAYNNHVRACYDQIEKLKKELQSGNNLTEQREAIRNARENGNPEPNFKSVMELKNNISELYETDAIYRFINEVKISINEIKSILRKKLKVGIM